MEISFPEEEGHEIKLELGWMTSFEELEFLHLECVSVISSNSFGTKLRFKSLTHLSLTTGGSEDAYQLTEHSACMLFYASMTDTLKYLDIMYMIDDDQETRSHPCWEDVRRSSNIILMERI